MFQFVAQCRAIQEIRVSSYASGMAMSVMINPPVPRRCVTVPLKSLVTVGSLHHLIPAASE
jgi:hypothetical protein